MKTPQSVTIELDGGDRVTFAAVPLKENPSQMHDWGTQFARRVFQKDSPAMHVVRDQDVSALQEMLKAAGTDAARVTAKAGNNDCRFRVGQIMTVFGTHIAEIDVADLILA